MVAATYTWQEYNDWGGGCGYFSDEYIDHTADPLEVREKSFKPRLSFHRPWSRGLIRTPVGAPRLAQPPPPVGAAVGVPAADWAISHGYSVWTVAAGWARYDALTFRWLEANGYEPELLSQWDLDRDPAVLDGYRAVVTTGHDEYWTAAGRAVLDRFITEGGRYARLAGNIVWQVRMEDGLRTQVCHKYAAHADPERHSDDIDLRTGAFEGHYIDRPPVTTFGANGLRGVYSRMGGLSPRGAGGFIVYRPEHWAFAGADIYYADVLGGDIPLVGYETDGMDYTFRSGLPYPTGADGAPEGLEILALTPVTLEEQDHGQAGNLISIADGDLSFAAEAIHGEDTPENRNKLRYGSAAITSMPKGRGRGVLRGHDGVVPRPGPRRPPSGDHHRQRPGPLPRQLIATGSGLLTNFHWPIWHPRRRLILKPVGARTVGRFATRMASIIDDEMDCWPVDEEFEMRDRVHALTLRMPRHHRGALRDPQHPPCSYDSPCGCTTDRTHETTGCRP